MELSSRYTITVNQNSPAIARAGFGTPLIIGNISNTILDGPGELTREYIASTALTEMIADGFTVNHPVYIAAQGVLAQSPRPTKIKVGRMATSFTYGVELTPMTFAAGQTISFNLVKAGVTCAVTRTCGGVSLNAEATAIDVIISAHAFVTGGEATSVVSGGGAGNVVEFDAVSPAHVNKLWYITEPHNILISDVTADRGIAADLAAILAYDSDWYCIVPADSFGATELALIATFAETNLKLAVIATQDTLVATAGTGIFATLKAATRRRSVPLYNREGMNEAPGAAYAGRFLPIVPGKGVWADKSLSGVTYWSNPTAAQLTNVELQVGGVRYGNHYTLTAGVGNVWPGVTASGEDVEDIRVADEMVARIAEDIFSASRAMDKIPFTDAGVALIKGICLSRLQTKVPYALVEGSLTFDAPRVADVSAADKAIKHLPGVVIGAQLAGSIKTMAIEINLTF